MKKLIVVVVFAALCGTLRAQTTGEELGQIDNAVKSLAAKVANKLAEEKARTVIVGPFAYMGTNTMFNSYLGNQLTEELLGVRGRPFTMSLGGVPAEFVVSGDIVRIDNIVRIYARVVRRESNDIVSQVSVDMNTSQSISNMLISVGGNDYAVAMPDTLEADSWDAPVMYEVWDGDGDVTTVMRSIHAGDEDWFRISTTSPLQLMAETTGDMDTYIELYDADTREQLSSNDDGNRGDGNAQVAFFARPGKNYMVKVRGYSEVTTGNYGFEVSSEEMGEPVPYEVHDDINDARFVMGVLGGNDDTFLLVPDAGGNMVMETTGESDVFMEFYDAETFEQLASDDDSGYDSNARITYSVERGKRYLAKVRAFSSNETGQYGFKAYLNRR